MFSLVLTTNLVIAQSSIHNAATMLLDIGGLVCFLFVVYGLLGVQMFGPMDVGECAFPKNLSRDESLAGSIAQPVSPCFRADEACGSRTLNISGVDARHENMELQCRLLTTAETGTIQFDHLGWALLSLLQIATTDGWWQPFTRFRQYSDVGASLYWTTFIVAACFCVLQMITAIVVQVCSMDHHHFYCFASTKNTLNRNTGLFSNCTT